MRTFSICARSVATSTGLRMTRWTCAPMNAPLAASMAPPVRRRTAAARRGRGGRGELEPREEGLGSAVGHDDVTDDSVQVFVQLTDERERTLHRPCLLD